MTRLQKVVLWSALTLFGVWVVCNFGRLTADQEGLIRFVLGLLFAV